jgi:hypothetical protein
MDIATLALSLIHLGAFAPDLTDWEEHNIQPIRNKEEFKNKS